MAIVIIEPGGLNALASLEVFNVLDPLIHFGLSVCQFWALLALIECEVERLK